MELLQLQYFKVIAECQHITKAASQLMISQPSLSNTLARIEHELGVQLFDRQKRNIVLNNYGKIVLEHTNNILRELDNIHTEIDELRERHSRVINIASTDSVYLKGWLPDFITQNPDLIIRHTLSTEDRIKSGLRNGTLDFGLTDNLFKDKSFSHVSLWQDEYVVLAPRNHPLTSQAERDFADFKDAPFVCLPKSENISRPIDVLSDVAGFKPNIIFEGERELIQRVLLPIHGFIIINKSVINTDADWQLCEQYCTPISLTNPRAHINIAISYDPDRTLSSSAERFLEFVKTSAITPWHISEFDDEAANEYAQMQKN